MLMENSEVVIPNLENYISIKEAAGLLKMSYKTVYQYVSEGRIPAVRASDVILLRVEDVKNFKPKLSGRPRTTIPPWRISPEDNLLQQTIISVQIRKGRKNALIKRLDEIRQSKEHLFPGTIARYIIGRKKMPDRIEITLVWRASVMPDEAAREGSLEAFRQELADVLDWQTAEYDEGTVLMHT